MTKAVTSDTLALITAARADGGSADVAKNFTQPNGSPMQGLQAYNLAPGAQKLYPVITPLRNRIARVGGGFATQANWKAITGINTTGARAGVSEGQRGGQVHHTTADRFAAFRGIGLEKSVTFEGDYAAKGFEDLKSLAVVQTLQSLMVQEEMIILGGNTSAQMGTTPTPALAAGTGGALASGALSVVCVALGLQAYWDVAGSNNGNTGQTLNIDTAQVPALITRTNADGSTDTFGGGSACKSQAASVSVSASGKVSAKLPNAVRGAVGYAWYWGAAGSEVLGAVTTTADVIISANAAGAQTAASLPGKDHSTSALEFDGLITQISKDGGGGYWRDNGGNALTSDGAGGVLEFEAAFLDFYNKYRLSPQTIYVNAADLTGLTRLIIGSGGAPLLRLNVDANNTQSIRAGVAVGSYLNKVTGETLDVVVHPNMAPGSVMFYSDRIPAYLDGVGTLMRILTRQDYYQIEWPLRTRKYEYGVYADEVLQGFFMPAFGLITNAKTTA